MTTSTLAAAVVLSLAAFAFAQPTTTANAFPVSVEVDASKPLGPVKPIYRFFGCDEPNYAYSPAGKRLLRELGKLGTPEHPVYFRTHNLLCTGDGTPGLKWGSTNIYTEDADGRPIYDYTIVDRIIDAYVEAGVKPYLQIGFMPKALSTKPEPYEHHWTPAMKYDAIFTGWAYPPKNYAKWEELVYQWTKHCVDRYGQTEVEKWYFQTWNEPNYYFKAPQAEFNKLNDFAMRAVKRALPTARVGGPDTAGDGGKYMDDFLAHCLDGTNFATGEKGTPLEFLSFHAKGSPIVLDGHVRMGISAQLKTLDKGFERFARDARTKKLPVVIGESDPEGCAACQGPQLAYRNGTVYSSYTAAAYLRHLQLADRHGVDLEGMLTWAFLFDGEPIFAGFRVLASGEVDHPVLNVFRMLAMMTGSRIEANSSAEVPLDDIVANGVRANPDVAALASDNGKSVAVMLWHYHDDDKPGPDAATTITLRGLGTSTSATVTEYRIDATHSNSFTAWQRMGSPKEPTKEQLGELQTAGLLQSTGEARKIDLANGTASITVTLPRQAVVLFTIERK
jgi:xylan 1,4-beta-xylosidase